MSKDACIAAIIALIVGVCVGHFLIPPTPPEPTPPIDRGEGDPVPPSQLVQGVAKGTWPMVDCSGTMAIDILDEIYTLASNDVLSGQLDGAMFAQILNGLYKCAMNTAPSKLNTEAHCAIVMSALEKAKQHDWSASLGDIEHDH